MTKDSAEFKLWAEAYALRDEMMKPHANTNEYWRTVLDRAHSSFDRYKETPLRTLAEYLFAGIILQLDIETQ